MRLSARRIFDRCFTVVTAGATGLLVVVLAVILGPMLWRATGAVVFKGTVEFRKMQLALFERGSRQQVEGETGRAMQVREKAYQMLEDFKQGIDPEALIEKAGDIHRDFRDELRAKEVSGEEYRRLRQVSRDIRDRLEEVFESRDKDTVAAGIEYVLQYRTEADLQGTAAERYFELAGHYRRMVKDVDLEKREEYSQSLAEVEELLGELLGPRPGEAAPALMRLRYGATRWDKAQELVGRIVYAERWVEVEPGQPLVKKRIPRATQFAGTPLEGFFGFVEEHSDEMLLPRRTFYWQYFVDDQVSSHYFGGIGPEILGTLILTVLSIILVVPPAVISAAYLVECAGENAATRVIRMCINTLAGVPSIVFGLFGLAFFVGFVQPRLGLPGQPCILAASLTLAVLALPVMIRASEEAIKAVPATYKEASLALGASRLRTFVKVTLPAALPGILTGLILSLGRVAGETAPILFTGAVAFGGVPDSLLDPTRTLSYGSYDMAVGDRIAKMVPHNQYGMVVTLVVLVLLLNAAAIIVRWRVSRKLRGQ